VGSRGTRLHLRNILQLERDVNIRTSLFWDGGCGEILGYRLDMSEPCKQVASWWWSVHLLLKFWCRPRVSGSACPLGWCVVKSTFSLNSTQIFALVKVELGKDGISCFHS
jgi:hypothetical protein